MVMKCPKCESQHCVKAGFNHNRQRYKCKDCKYQFTQITDKNTTKRAFALYLYAVGLSMNAIGRMLKVEPSTILYWVKNFALKTYEKPTPQGEVLIELDEMWHFLRSKKTRSRSGRHIVELPASLGIGNAEIEVRKR
jgi:transposase-like protein